VIVLPTDVRVIFDPGASVTSPVRPFRLITPALPARSEFRKDISNPAASLLPLASCVPYTITFPVPPMTVVQSRALRVEIPGTTSLTLN
jgi:hypothetical protein